MLLSLLQFFATKFLVLALHLEAGSFPKPLTAREEIETFAALRRSILRRRRKDHSSVICSPSSSARISAPVAGRLRTR